MKGKARKQKNITMVCINKQEGKDGQEADMIEMKSGKMN